MGRGEYRETIKYEGKRYEVTASSPEKLKEKVYQKRKELESGFKEKKITVDKWFEEWVENYKKGKVCEAYYIDIRRIYKNQIKPVIGHMNVADVKPMHIQDLVYSLYDYSLNYTNQILCIVREIFYDAVDNGLTQKNPALNIRKTEKQEPSFRRTITEDERQLILRTCEKHWGGLFVKMVLFCGLRPGEVSALTWADVDLDNRIIHVTKALKEDDYIGPPKTSAGIRNVFIPDQFMEELSVLKKGKNPEDLVCVSKKGLLMRKNNTQRMWESFVRMMNIEMGCKITKRGKPIPPFFVAPDLTLYCLRHTYCTDLQTAGISVNVAKEFMGHASIHMTADIYTHTKVTDIESARLLYDNYEKPQN